MENSLQKNSISKTKCTSIENQNLYESFEKELSNQVINKKHRDFFNNVLDKTSVLSIEESNSSVKFVSHKRNNQSIDKLVKYKSSNSIKQISFWRKTCIESIERFINYKRFFYSKQFFGKLLSNSQSSMFINNMLNNQKLYPTQQKSVIIGPSSEYNSTIITQFIKLQQKLQAHQNFQIPGKLRAFFEKILMGSEEKGSTLDSAIILMKQELNRIKTIKSNKPNNYKITDQQIYLLVAINLVSIINESKFQLSKLLIYIHFMISQFQDLKQVLRKISQKNFQQVFKLLNRLLRRAQNKQYDSQLVSTSDLVQLVKDLVDKVSQKTKQDKIKNKKPFLNKNLIDSKVSLSNYPDLIIQCQFLTEKVKFLEEQLSKYRNSKKQNTILSNSGSNKTVNLTVSNLKDQNILMKEKHKGKISNIEVKLQEQFQEVYQQKLKELVIQNQKLLKDTKKLQNQKQRFAAQLDTLKTKQKLTFMDDKIQTHFKSFSIVVEGQNDLYFKQNPINSLLSPASNAYFQRLQENKSQAFSILSNSTQKQKNTREYSIQLLDKIKNQRKPKIDKISGASLCFSQVSEDQRFSFKNQNSKDTNNITMLFQKQIQELALKYQQAIEKKEKQWKQKYSQLKNKMQQSLKEREIQIIQQYQLQKTQLKISLQRELQIKWENCIIPSKLRQLQKYITLQAQQKIQKTQQEIINKIVQKYQTQINSLFQEIQKEKKQSNSLRECLKNIQIKYSSLAEQYNNTKNNQKAIKQQSLIFYQATEPNQQNLYKKKIAQLILINQSLKKQNLELLYKQSIGKKQKIIHEDNLFQSQLEASITSSLQFCDKQSKDQLFEKMSYSRGMLQNNQQRYNINVKIDRSSKVNNLSYRNTTQLQQINFKLSKEKIFYKKEVSTLQNQNKLLIDRIQSLEKDLSSRKKELNDLKKDYYDLQWNHQQYITSLLKIDKEDFIYLNQYTKSEDKNYHIRSKTQLPKTINIIQDHFIKNIVKLKVELKKWNESQYKANSKNNFMEINENIKQLFKSKSLSQSQEELNKFFALSPSMHPKQYLLYLNQILKKFIFVMVETNKSDPINTNFSYDINQLDEYKNQQNKAQAIKQCLQVLNQIKIFVKQCYEIEELQSKTLIESFHQLSIL